MLVEARAVRRDVAETSFDGVHRVLHSEWNHQGKGNVLLFSSPDDYASTGDRVECRKRLGGLLRYYSSAA
jgi:hypothetical protein